MKITDYVRQDDQQLRELRSIAAQQINDEPSKTMQGPALEADVNYIAKAYGLTGKTLPIPPEAFDPSYYGDLSDVPDLATALNRIRDAEDHFMRLPPDLRRRFHDSPGVLWDFVNNPANSEESIALGLLHRPPEALKTESAPVTPTGDTP